MASGVPSGAGTGELLGRERELALLQNAIEGAAAGRGSTLGLAGEPGIGKSRLAIEAAASAEARGLRVCWGRCWEAGGAPAYWPWLDVLALAQRDLSDPELLDALGDGAALLRELVPEVRARVPASEGSALPPEQARFALLRAVGRLLLCAARPSGLVVLLEDLHAADRASLSLLCFVARELRDAPLLVVATWRDRDADVSPEVRELLATLEREATVVGLGRLDRNAATALALRHVGQDAAAIAERIFERSQGHPLFLNEMLRLFDQHGPEAIDAGALPLGVREAIERRLTRLSGDARDLLELGAVLGDELEPTRLSSAAERDVAELSPTLDEAVASGALVAHGIRYRFSHALVREVLYGSLTEQRRRDLHARVANALQREHSTGGAPPFAELAHHALRGPRELLGRGVTAATGAAERALELLCYDDAVTGLTTALASVARAGDPPAERLRVLLGLGAALIRRGDAEAGKARCLEAAGLAREHGDALSLALAALTFGNVFRFATVDPTLVDLLEEALEALPESESETHGALRARLLARLAGALQPTPSTQEPVALAHEAFATARRLGDPRTLLQTLHDGMSALMDVAPPAERLRLNLEIEQLSLELDDRECLLRTHGRLVVDHLGLDELAAADARIDAFEALAHELRAPWHAWRVSLFRALRALMHGELSRAEALFERAQEQGHPGDAMFELVTVSHREGFLRAAERHADMVAFDPAARRARAPVRYAPVWQAMGSALVCTRREEPEQARAYLDVMPEAAYPPVDNLYAVYFAAEPAALVGSEALATRIHDLLLPHAGECVVLGLSYLGWEGPVTRLLALLCARLGRHDQARAHFEAAIAHAERLEAPLHAARARYELARLLLEHPPDADADSAQARTLLSAARETAERAPLPGLATLCDARLAGLRSLGTVRDAAPPAGTADADVDEPLQAAPSMTLEGEYWTIAHAGRTFRLKDGLGLQYVARLLAEPRRDLHVLDLAGGNASAERGALDRGDAGELLDERARQQYRRRLEDLRETLEEAESFGDGGRAERAREEIEALTTELSRAVGRGGRARRAGGAAERARSAVRRRIRHTLDRICEHDPELGAYLERTVRTGLYCVYRPELAER